MRRIETWNAELARRFAAEINEVVLLLRPPGVPEGGQWERDIADAYYSIVRQAAAGELTEAGVRDAAKAEIARFNAVASGP